MTEVTVRMTFWRMAGREIMRRKVNFGMGLFSVTLATATLAGSLTMLKAHDVRTAQIAASKQEETKRRMLALEDDYRKIMKKLGFNLLILPKEQNLADLYEGDSGIRYMPEEFVDRLAASDIITIQHLLPTLQEKIFWPEKQRTIILMGIRGEVPFQRGNAKEPILTAVPEGRIILGHELHRSLDLKVGDPIRLLGRVFTVSQCNEERGNKDDITLWINLQEAQELLHRPEQINAIQALQCFCADNAISRIRSDVARILPGTQVIEEGTKVVARAEARARAAREAREAVEAEMRNRASHRREQERFASILVPLVMAGCGVWIALLFFANTRDRRGEIGILRAMGVRSGKILYLILIKALLIGLCGALLGSFLGVLAGALSQGVAWSGSLFDGRLLLIALLAAPLMSLMAGWIPALLASQQDPAVVMREE